MPAARAARRERRFISMAPSGKVIAEGKSLAADIDAAGPNHELADGVDLGLPADDPFWTAPAESWTQKRIWAGEDVKADHAYHAKK